MKKIKLQTRLFQPGEHWKGQLHDIDGYAVAPGLAIIRSIKNGPGEIKQESQYWDIIHIPSGYAIPPKMIKYKEYAEDAALELAELTDWTQDSETIIELLRDSNKRRAIVEKYQ